MIRRVISLLLVAAFTSLGAQSSGIFFDAHVSRGVMKGDKLYDFTGSSFGSIVHEGEGLDTVHLISNGKEVVGVGNGFEKVDFQYNVRYSFAVGYEKSFNKVLSLRGAVGYQNALMNAYAATISGYLEGDMTEDPYISSEISRHWLTIPIDLKVTLPIRRAGIYVAAGPKMSILLSSKYSDSLANTTEDITDLTPRFNLQLGFRLGAEFPIGKAGYIYVESGYHKGLINLSPVSEASTKEGEITLLGAGFRINLPAIK